MVGVMPIRIGGLGKLLGTISSGASSPKGSIQGSNQAVSGLLRNDLRGTAFLNAVEKHLSDFKSGNGQLSREVGLQLQERDQATRSLINSNSPALAATYAGYASALNYTRRARFIEGVSSAQQRVSEIQSIQDKAPDAKEIESLFEPKGVDVEA